MENTQRVTTKQKILELVEHQPGRYRQAHLVKKFGVSRERVSQIINKLELKDKLKQPESVVVKSEAMKLKTRVFELCNGKYTNLTELAHAMGISVSQVYRVRQGKRPSNAIFITGAKKAFPEYMLDDLFYVDSEGDQEWPKITGIT